MDINDLEPIQNIYDQPDLGSRCFMEEKPSIETTRNRDEEILRKIRNQMQELEILIEAMKSKLPNTSRPNE